MSGYNCGSFISDKYTRYGEFLLNLPFSSIDSKCITYATNLNLYFYIDNTNIYSSNRNLDNFNVIYTISNEGYKAHNIHYDNKNEVILVSCINESNKMIFLYYSYDGIIWNKTEDLFSYTNSLSSYVNIVNSSSNLLIVFSCNDDTDNPNHETLVYNCTNSDFTKSSNWSKTQEFSKDILDDMNNVKSLNNKFFISMVDETTQQQVLKYSDDGVSWNDITLPDATGLYGLCSFCYYKNNYYICFVGYNGDPSAQTKIYLSSDCVSWSNKQVIELVSGLSVAANENVMLLVGDYNFYSNSDDIEHLNLQTSNCLKFVNDNYSSNCLVNFVVYLDNKFIVVYIDKDSNNIYFTYSIDGINDWVSTKVCLYQLSGEDIINKELNKDVYPKINNLVRTIGDINTVLDNINGEVI